LQQFFIGNKENTSSFIPASTPSYSSFLTRANAANVLHKPYKNEKLPVLL